MGSEGHPRPRTENRDQQKSQPQNVVAKGKHRPENLFWWGRKANRGTRGGNNNDQVPDVENNLPVRGRIALFMDFQKFIQKCA